MTNARTADDIVLEHFTRGDLEKMSVEDLLDRIQEVKKRYPTAKISGTAVVRKADGTVRTDDS